MAPAPPPGSSHWPCRPRAPRSAGRPRRRCRRSCGFRRPGSCAAPSTPPPGRRCRRRRSANRASPRAFRPPEARRRSATPWRHRRAGSWHWGSGGEARLRPRRRSGGKCPWASPRPASVPRACRASHSGWSRRARRRARPTGSCPAGPWRRHKSGSAPHSPNRKSPRSRSCLHSNYSRPAGRGRPGCRRPAKRPCRG